jgi:hypothetical protein
MLSFARLAFILAAPLIGQQPDTSEGKHVRLWATISVQPTIYWEGNTDAVQVHFGLKEDRCALACLKFFQAAGDASGRCWIKRRASSADSGVPCRMHSLLSDLCQRSSFPFDCG